MEKSVIKNANMYYEKRNVGVLEVLALGKYIVTYTLNVQEMHLILLYIQRFNLWMLQLKSTSISSGVIIRASKRKIREAYLY